MGGAVEGVVGRADEGVKKIGGADAELVAEAGKVPLVAAIGLLELEGDAVGDEEAVLGEPGRGDSAEGGVFPRLAGQGGEAGVDARDVGFEQGAEVGGQGGDGIAGAGAEAVDDDGAVEFEGSLADEGG